MVTNLRFLWILHRVRNLPLPQVYFDVGNHFVCKEEYADAFVKFFDGMEGYEIICDGFRKIQNEKFIETLVVGEKN